MARSIRPLYDQYGAEGYYQSQSDLYENPHLPLIERLLEQNNHRLDLKGKVLDFAAGGGEVTRALVRMGVREIEGSDPFTWSLYEKNTGLTCHRFSFMDVVKNGLGGTYSTIISSFAMHLCPQKDLFSLTWNLFQAAPLLVIITPHKRPELELLPGIELLWQDITEDDRGKKVRMKAYRMLTGHQVEL
ncbi:MAG: hypothetical protein ACKOCH_06595 [Bacteroidota bacterium]